MAKDSLNLRNRAEAGKTRFAQTVPGLFSARLRKFKAPSRASTATPSQFGRSRKGGNPAAFSGQATTLGPRLRGDDGERSVVGSAPAVWPFLPLMAPWIFVSGRKKDGELSERSEFSPSPPGYENPRRVSPSRARLSLLTFFGKTKKVSQPRQGMKQGMDPQPQNQTRRTPNSI